MMLVPTLEFCHQDLETIAIINTLTNRFQQLYNVGCHTFRKLRQIFMVLRSFVTDFAADRNDELVLVEVK